VDERTARERMVAEQIVARHAFSARVLEAMREIPRHRFVPERQQRDAYDDRPLPIGDGQTISQPYMVALMTEALAPGIDDRVLEIGTGSGYQTAILCRLAHEVISIERHPRLAAGARAVLAELGITNVQITVADGSKGDPATAPFTRILVTAGAPAVPDTLRRQLADGGRLVIPVGPSAVQHLTVINRVGETWTEHQGEACVFVPLIGCHAWSG
jgi:protein-L-isoaspartate(D-aspartate) O-methyltransferase